MALFNMIRFKIVKWFLCVVAYELFKTALKLLQLLGYAITNNVAEIKNKWRSN